MNRLLGSRAHVDHVRHDTHGPKNVRRSAGTRRSPPKSGETRASSVDAAFSLALHVPWLRFGRTPSRMNELRWLEWWPRRYAKKLQAQGPGKEPSARLTTGLQRATDDVLPFFGSSSIAWQRLVCRFAALGQSFRVGYAPICTLNVPECGTCVKLIVGNSCSRKRNEVLLSEFRVWSDSEIPRERRRPRNR